MCAFRTAAALWQRSVCRIGVAGPFAVESLSPHRTLAVGWNDELIDLQRKGVAELQAGAPQNVASVSLENLRGTSVQQSSKQDRISFAGLTGWAGKDVCAEGRVLQGTQGAVSAGGAAGTEARERRARILFGPEFGTVSPLRCPERQTDSDAEHHTTHKPFRRGLHWTGHKLDFLRWLLPFARGIPSHDTLNDVMNAFDARSIAEAIRAKGAGSLLALKDNWPTLAEQVRLLFDRAPPGSLDTHQTVDADHGRIETRRHAVAREVDWLATDRRLPAEPRFPGLAAIARVEAELERDGRITKAHRCSLSSAALDARLFARAVRAHWGIENQLHRVMDGVFHDDLRRLRTQHGPANMATVRHIALNLLRATPGKQSLAVKRKSAGWDNQCLLRTITQKP